MSIIQTLQFAAV
ncbi:hypothetical protein F383_38739 [Gossypium arboreum]|uniref:Uncharacterized protein n=1 Tax=Gossypium arboreum TaxID=29729 RepID=A0A0B0MGT5_GOSAR|nr:hypothetical protein F383_38739 [Gossypium arboreum]